MLELFQSIAPYILPIYYLAIFGVVINILLENRNPLKTHSYLLLLLLLPILGIVIYLFFGQKFRKRKVFNKRKLINSAFGRDYIERYLDKTLNLDFPRNELPDHFERLANFLSHDLSPLTSNNHLQVLRNGEEKFEKLMTALTNAKSYIHIEYYIFSDDSIGQKVRDLLIAKAQEGIEVKLIVDAVGSFSLKNDFLNELREAGVQVHRFRPVLFPLFTSKLNYRDHRKIVIIDGTQGFTGGINLDDRYLNNGKHNLYWRDTHLFLEGESVKSLQLLFLLTWTFASGQEIKEPAQYFPKCAPIGTHFVQINGSGPDWELASIMDSFFLAINSARENIRIATPYFIPSESILNALLISAKSGVQIEIMLPYESDSWIVQAASMSFVKPLLEGGIRVYLYQKGFLHAKTLTVDDIFSCVGTANMDHRSFDINYEVNTYIYDVGLAKELNRQFEEDKGDCLMIGLEEWKQRNIRQKFQESLCRLLAPLL